MWVTHERYATAAACACKRKLPLIAAMPAGNSYEHSIDQGKVKKCSSHAMPESQLEQKFSIGEFFLTVSSRVRSQHELTLPK